MSKKYTILSIDDSSANSKLIAAYFQKDYNVISKNNGHEALSWLKHHMPDVILLDIMLPGMNGKEILKSIKEDEHLQNIPVIMVTAKTEVVHIREAFRIGAYDYVKKPLDFVELKSKILFAIQMNQYREEVNKTKIYHDIHDAMIHTQRLQRSMLPDAESFRKVFPKSFVLNQPKHIISSDFYWVMQKRNQKHLALLNCAGHGMSAAMLTMLGQSELHNISGNVNDIKGEQVFSYLSYKLSSILNRSNDTHSPFSNMNGIFCSVYPYDNRLEFTGAKSSLVIIKKNVNRLHINSQLILPSHQHKNFFLYEIKGDQFSIGESACKQKFATNTVDVLPEDRLFLFSGGIADQRGRDQIKYINKNNFFEKLISIQLKSITNQKPEIYSCIGEWKENHEQIEDILLIGIEI